MSMTIQATFDGQVFRPDQPPALPPNTRVEITIKPVDEHQPPAQSKSSFELYRNRPDKEWGMTDYISFVIMQERGISDALTADDHFRQAGFRALLLENP